MKIKFKTILRTVLQVLAYVNQFVAVLGQTTFAQNPVYQWVTFCVTVAVTLVTFWYNNDFTHMAIVTGELLEMLKDGKITKEEVETFMAGHKK